MGLFGFGKKKRQSEEAAEAAAEENDKADEAISETAEAPAGGIQETILPEPSDEYDGRGDEHGPWDVDDENVPDYDEYLDMGAYYLPFLQGIELRVKANRATQQVLGTTITYGSSSVEIEAFAAPKTMGLWDDVRADLVEANKDAKETDGVFGTELTLPVVVKGGRKVVTRIVGVDGPRWMLRGIFSGKAANDDGNSDTEALNKYFADIVVERGDEPLAPTAEGRAYGIEAMVRWQIPDRLHVVGSVTVYRSEYRSGRRARYIASAWDNRFVLNLSGTYELPKAWSIGAKLSAIGGAPYTPYDTEKSSLKEAWDARGRPYYDYSRYNEGRLPAFAQLDLRIDKAFYFRRCTLGIYVDLQNVTGSKLRQPDVLMSTGIVENPSAPASEQRYRMKYIKQESGTLVPALGVTVEF